MRTVTDNFVDDICFFKPFKNNYLLMLFSAFCMAISKRVLSRMCLYWLPRYLLHLRMKDLSKDPDFADKDGLELSSLSDWLRSIWPSDWTN